MAKAMVRPYHLSCSGPISIAGGILVSINDPQMSYPLFTKIDLERADKIRKTTDSGGIFLTARNHNNIISSLSGRKLFLGFGGYLWTHGIQNTAEKEADIVSIYSGSSDIDFLIRKNNIRYIVLSPWEYNEYKYVDTRKLESLYVNIYDDGNYKILDTDLKLNPAKFIYPQNSP